MHVCVHVCMCVCMLVCVHTCTYIHTYINFVTFNIVNPVLLHYMSVCAHLTDRKTAWFSSENFGLL